MIDESRTPARIYNWLHSQLSIARFYGGCAYNGASYVIAHDEEGEPLKRVDPKPKAKRRAAVPKLARKAIASQSAGVEVKSC